MDLSACAASDDRVPAPASIGLALAVVRSKPPGATVDEHLDLIIKNFSDGVSLSGHGRPARLDAVAYWKDEYQRANSEKAALEDEVIRLRDELQGLRQPARSAQKRKQDSQTTTKANTQSKRRRLDDDSERGNDDTVLVEMQEAQDPGIKELLRALIQLQQLMTSNPSDPNELQRRLSRLCNAISGVLTHETELANRIFPLYICMLKSLRHIHELDRPDGAIITTSCGFIVRLFQSLLGHFHQIALNEIARRERNEKQKSKKPKSNSKATKSSTPEAEELCRTRLEALVKVMSAVFLAVDATSEPDNVLCESLISTLFDHIGSSLSLLVFIDPGNKDPGLEPVTGLLDVAHIEPESAIATAELSAPYLISVMRTALGRVRASKLSIDSNASKPSNDSNSDREALLHRIEERLQHTLLRGVFGDDDMIFDQAFVRVEEAEAQDLPEVIQEADQEANRTDWFIGQVWELLGWDLLSGKGARARAPVS